MLDWDKRVYHQQITSRMIAPNKTLVTDWFNKKKKKEKENVKEKSIFKLFTLSIYIYILAVK